MNKWEKILKEEEKCRQWEKTLKKRGINCLICQKIITPNAYKNHNYWLRKEGVYHNKCWKWTTFNKILELDKEKKFTTWEELVKKYPCCSCDYNFTEEEIKTRNWQARYSEENGTPEIYSISHIDCSNCLCSKCWKVRSARGPGCMDCRVPLGNLVIVNYDTSYHPNCLAKKQKYYSFHTHPQIKKIKVADQKITATLEEGREISLTLDWIKKKHYWLKKDIKEENLRKYLISPGGIWVTFKIDEDNELDISIFEFTEGTYLGKCGCCSPVNYN
ncbi:MAG: hypothetical protein I3273_02450 [Candidatus Moeniiplasma glomeromycotorum]|nr:hypothetical protein [Candidatus Moeniiplasma glomeromycotorum]MCE8167022.1 hypothetical protein [Candidatus Moeniiplasma glomeromycotorum]MCE8168966.1 hypothetical protein [Candidatus Moeniiplasma glomeromycotorum]